MPRAPRRESASGFYHITVRGVGKRIIFEDEEDRVFALKQIERVFDEEKVEVHAWCFMRNHIHMLARGSVKAVSNAMQRFGTTYAVYYNGKHGHVGAVFQGRYGCEPIDSEEHLLLALCYIHQNPLRAGEVEDYEFRWSSYGEYLGTSQTWLCTTAFFLKLFDGRENFVSFHETQRGLTEIPLGNSGSRLDDAEAERLARDLFGPNFTTSIALLPKQQRDKAIRVLRAYGVSIRQIERLTGIGRNIIARA